MKLQKEIMNLLNPDQIVNIKISDPIQYIGNALVNYRVIKIDTRPWYVKLFYPNSEPEYEYRIKERISRHTDIITFEEFFSDPENEELFLYPIIEDGILSSETLIYKPSVKISTSDGDEFKRTFENIDDRDNWLKETGLDKLEDKFIHLNKD